MAWIVLFVAGLMEIGWAIGLKYTEGFTRLVPSALTLACMAVGGHRHIPLVEDAGAPTGFVSIRGILRYLAQNVL